MPPTLAILAKPPLLGRVKTRLARTIGDADALSVYRALIDRTARVAAHWSGRTVVFLAGDRASLADTALAPYDTRPQAGGGLGARLLAAFHELRAPCLFIGTDCPALTADHLATLAARLADAAIAFGPARDGGYWGVAIGDARCAGLCFADDLPWSQPSLLAGSCARATSAGFQPALTDALDDLDDEADLRRAEAAGFAWRSSDAGIAR